MLFHDELQYVLAVTAPTKFSPNRQTLFLRIAKHDFSKSPNTISPNRRPRFLQNAKYVFSKTPNTFSPKRRIRFLQIAEFVFSKSPNSFSPNRRTRFLQIAKHFLIEEQHAFFFLISSETTQSPISPYTCYGLRALRYVWSAVVLWSHLFFLHVYGLCARRYGLWVSQG